MYREYLIRFSSSMLCIMAHYLFSVLACWVLWAVISEIVLFSGSFIIPSALKLVVILDDNPYVQKVYFISFKLLVWLLESNSNYTLLCLTEKIDAP